MATIEERFQAAVNVIKGLPKNGPYQPSTSMMLKFYGLFKQATEGACEQKKPGFWDVVGRAKWDAWASNKHLSKQQAMKRYVDSLQEIIETMSFTENVQNFVGSVSGLENINLDELDMISPGMRVLAESHPNSPFNSRTNSPQHGASANTTPSSEQSPLLSEHTAANCNQTATSAAILTNGHVTNGHETSTHVVNGYVEQDPTPPLSTNLTGIATGAVNYSNNVTVEPSDDEYDDPYDLNHDLSQQTELLKQVQAAVARINLDICSVNQRMGNLERSLQEIRCSQQQIEGVATNIKSVTSRHPNWWPFSDISPGWFVLLVFWPFVMKRFGRLLDSNTRPRHR